ncbi:MAG TPA: universal stress protein [Gemmatimonadales bacterium]|nr:universal stress protein [Gemmatimonadales bacterium]
MRVQRILAAVDLSTSTPRAVLTAAELAAGARAELVVLTVIGDPWAFVEAGEVEGQRRAHIGSFSGLAASRATKRLRELTSSAILPARAVEFRTAFGVPAIEIIRCAQEESADLIVLGRPAVDPGRPPEKSVTAAVLQRSRVPVVLAPLHHVTVHRVVAAVDGGPPSLVAEIRDVAETLAGTYGASIAALHVERPGTAPVAGSSWEMPPGGGTAVATQWEVLLRHGEPVHEILAAIEEHQVDLLVVGYRRGAAVSGGPENCIAGQVLRRASCAAVAVPI